MFKRCEYLIVAGLRWVSGALVAISVPAVAQSLSLKSFVPPVTTVVRFGIDPTFKEKTGRPQATERINRSKARATHSRVSKPVQRRDPIGAIIAQPNLPTNQYE